MIHEIMGTVLKVSTNVKLSEFRSEEVDCIRYVSESDLLFYVSFISDVVMELADG